MLFLLNAPGLEPSGRKGCGNDQDSTAWFVQRLDVDRVTSCKPNGLQELFGHYHLPIGGDFVRAVGSMHLLSIQQVVEFVGCLNRTLVRRSELEDAK